MNLELSNDRREINWCAMKDKLIFPEHMAAGMDKRRSTKTVHGFGGLTRTFSDEL